MIGDNIRRRHLLAAAISALTVLLVSFMTTTPANAAVPGNWITQQVNFVAARQLSDGGILSSPTQIDPYFSNIAAMGLARANTATSRAVLLRWMGWYLAHMNNPDSSGLVDTVYDYSYDPSSGVQTPTGDYDSVDSYSSTTLNVARLAYATGDYTLRSFVKSHIRTYEAIASLITHPSGSGGVRDSNNLTFAKPTYHADYLMDNSEVYGGLTDFAKLESALGRTSQARYYSSWATTTKSAMDSLLWNSSTDTWDWALGSPSSLVTFYPDSVAQLWPIIWGVAGRTGTKAVMTWRKFNEAWPNWMHDSEPDSYPWAAMASASQRMGDTSDAYTLLTTIHNNYAPGWGLPNLCGAATCGSWYDAEAGWFLLGALHVTP